MRKTAISLGVVGVVFIIAAALLAFWITPTFVAVLQGGTNTTRTYSGTIAAAINPSALQQGNLSSAVQRNLAETITHNVKVLQTSGNTALVKDTNTVSVAGIKFGGSGTQYAVDRKTFEATTDHPADWSVTNAKGLTFNWPIDTKKQNYTGWNDITYTTTPLKYVREEKRGGINTYVFQTTVPASPVKNPQRLSSFPQKLPLNLLDALTKAGVVPASAAASLAKLFPGAAQIPLGYTYQASSTYWVAPATGIVVDVNTSEKQMAGVKLPTGKIVPLIPAFADSFKGTTASVDDAATDAKNGSNAITTLGVTVPIIALVVGIALIVVAIILWMRGRERGMPAPAAPPSAGARL